MADVLIRETTMLDVAELAINLRAADAAEIRAYGIKEPHAALVRSTVNSVLCWTGEVDGRVAAILGVAPLSIMSGIGSPWMMGTPLLDRHARVLVRETPGYIARMLRAFPHLVNFVHAENTTSVRWLRRLGFTLDAPTPHGPEGALFHKFEMKA